MGRIAVSDDEFAQLTEELRKLQTIFNAYHGRVGPRQAYAMPVVRSLNDIERIINPYGLEHGHRARSEFNGDLERRALLDRTRDVLDEIEIDFRVQLAPWHKGADSVLATARAILSKTAALPTVRPEIRQRLDELISDFQQPGISAGAATATATSGISQPKKRIGRPRKGMPSVNDRMAATVQHLPESIGWSCAQWAKHLMCAESSVVDAPTWKSLAVVKAGAEIKRLKGQPTYLHQRSGKRQKITE